MTKKITLSLITILSLTTAGAYEFKPVGFKAVGMGGTGVASTRGSLSGYYNPALLRFSDYTSEFSLNAGVRVRESNLIEPMDKLSDIDFQTTMDNIGNNIANKQIDTDGDGTADTGSVYNSQSDKGNIIKAITTLNNIGTNNAFNISVTPSLTAQISDAFAIGVYSNIDVGFRLNIDTDHLDLIFEDGGNYYLYNQLTDIYSASDSSEYEASSLEYAIDPNNGLTYIEVDTMFLAETPISYAKAYDWNSGTWSFGLNLKPMALVTSSQKVSLGESSDDADSDSENFETTYSPTIGLDLGIAYRPSNSKITLGLMGKNINSPTFTVDTTSVDNPQDDYTIDPMLRAGISLPIWNDNIEFAFDADLTENDTLIDGEKSQFVGAGIELHPASWFAFRVGAMQDIAAEKFDDGTILTTGLGFGLKWLQVDISAMVGTNTGTYDGNDIPKYAAVNFSLISRWGDGYNKKKVPQVIENIENELEQNTISPENRERIKRDSEKAFNELDNS